MAITRRAHVVEGTEKPVAKPIPLHVPAAECKQVSKIVEIPPGAATVIGECGSVSELTAYVLEGTLRASVAGSDEALQPGDCMVVRTDQPIVWTADANSRCRILSVAVK